MYLEREEMAVALHTATRLVRPGGSFCFTHFVEPQGEPKGSIVQPITRAALRRLATAAGMVDVRLHDMRHQGDRYAMTARAPARSGSIAAPISGSAPSPSLGTDGIERP